MLHVAALCVLFWRKFFLLPMIGLLGVLAKESFVPMSASGTVAWAIYEFRHRTWKPSATIWSVVMVLTGGKYRCSFPA